MLIAYIPCEVIRIFVNCIDLKIKYISNRLIFEVTIAINMYKLTTTIVCTFRCQNSKCVQCTMVMGKPNILDRVSLVSCLWWMG